MAAAHCRRDKGDRRTVDGVVEKFDERQASLGCPSGCKLNLRDHSLFEHLPEGFFVVEALAGHAIQLLDRHDPTLNENFNQRCHAVSPPVTYDSQKPDLTADGILAPYPR